MARRITGRFFTYKKKDWVMCGGVRCRIKEIHGNTVVLYRAGQKSINPFNSRHTLPVWVTTINDIFPRFSDQ